MASAKATKKAARGKSAGGARRGGSSTARAKAGRKSAGKAAHKAAGKKAATKTAASVLVVNMIPKSLSGEENQDSEPTLTVNPANPLHIVGSAFTPDPAGGNLAPIYVSTDG